MANKEMYDYLSSWPPDVSDDLGSIDLRAVEIIERGRKKQKRYVSSDRLSHEAIGFITGSYFEIEISWDYLSESDCGTLMDLYHDSAKANGFVNSFMWTHPTDGHIYTVAFTSELPRFIKRGARHYGVKKITLEVLGYTS